MEKRTESEVVIYKAEFSSLPRSNGIKKCPGCKSQLFEMEVDSLGRADGPFPVPFFLFIFLKSRVLLIVLCPPT